MIRIDPNNPDNPIITGGRQASTLGGRPITQSMISGLAGAMGQRAPTPTPVPQQYSAPAPMYTPPTSTSRAPAYQAPTPGGTYKPSQSLPSYIGSNPDYTTPYNPGEPPPYQNVYDWGQNPTDTSGFFTSNWNDPTTGLGYGDVNSKKGQAGLNYSYNAPVPWAPPVGALTAPTVPAQYKSGYMG